MIIYISRLFHVCSQKLNNFPLTPEFTYKYYTALGPNQQARVPTGGDDAERDAWANPGEAELAVTSTVEAIGSDASAMCLGRFGQHILVGTASGAVRIGRVWSDSRCVGGGCLAFPHQKYFFHVLLQCCYYTVCSIVHAMMAAQPIMLKLNDVGTYAEPCAWCVCTGVSVTRVIFRDHADCFFLRRRYPIRSVSPFLCSLAVI